MGKLKKHKKNFIDKLANYIVYNKQSKSIKYYINIFNMRLFNNLMHNKLFNKNPLNNLFIEEYNRNLINKYLYLYSVEDITNNIYVIYLKLYKKVKDKSYLKYYLTNHIANQIYSILLREFKNNNLDDYCFRDRQEEQLSQEDLIDFMSLESPNFLFDNTKLKYLNNYDKIFLYELYKHKSITMYNEPMPKLSIDKFIGHVSNLLHIYDTDILKNKFNHFKIKIMKQFSEP